VPSPSVFQPGGAAAWLARSAIIGGHHARAGAADASGHCMSIKSDRWIRRMAEQHGMIEPYEPGQVKPTGRGGGQRIVSYGTSSYGYDVRCASEFKVFTNINSTIVDPKTFDPKQLRGHRGR
jgi:hypothetical protein